MLQEIMQMFDVIGAFLIAIGMIIISMPLWPLFGLATVLWLVDPKTSPILVS